MYAENREHHSATPQRGSGRAQHIDLERYVPAYLTWTANKLSRGASSFYLKHFGVGIEIWRCLVLLAVDGACSANQVSRVIGMDKASVSRCFKRMQEGGLIRIELDQSDGRARIAVLTAKGRALHGDMRGVAMERERALLAVLSQGEAASLLALLQRVHENLPAVEAATEQFMSAKSMKVSGGRRTKRVDHG